MEKPKIQLLTTAQLGTGTAITVKCLSGNLLKLQTLLCEQKACITNVIDRKEGYTMYLAPSITPETIQSLINKINL